jgi:hypothetical protein
MKMIIHVNQHIIKSNAKTGAREPVLTVKTFPDVAAQSGMAAGIGS